VTDTARALLSAAVLSGSATGFFAWRLSRIAADEPERLVGELRLAQWAALLLAVSGAISIGLAIGAPATTTGNIDVTLGVAFVILSGIVLRREPRDALLLAAAGFLVHALTDIAHRPGWLSPDLAPRWYAVGSAVFDVYLAGVCYWARRR
jgi:hypothetical protein